jgi:hypothetical protein
MRLSKFAITMRAYVAPVATIFGVLLFATTIVDADVDFMGDMRPTFELSAPVVRPFSVRSLNVKSFRVKSLYDGSLNGSRAERLEAFFHLYQCPEPLYVDDYLRVADEKQLDYRLLPAISIRETQCGVHEKGNNRLGFHPDEETFTSVLAGIEFVGERLAEHPYYKGKDIEGKLFRYNPKPAYPGEVLRIMRQIEP